jgi:hypothetical protein
MPPGRAAGKASPPPGPGMEPAHPGPPKPGSQIPLPGRWPIRALIVSLVAIAAVVVSLAVVRHRGEQRLPEAELGLDEPPAAVDLNLDAIRAAGL